HARTECVDVGAGGIALVDEEVAMHLRDLGIADAQATTAGGIDQLPGLLAGRILEGRAAGAALDRLHFLAIGGDAVHLGEDVRGLARVALEQRLGEDEILRRAAMAILVMKLSDGKHVDVTLAIDSASLDHHLLRLAAMRATVHAQRAADAARNAAIEGKTRNAGLRPRAGDLHVGNGGAGAEPGAVVHLDLAEAATEPDHHAFDA